MTTRQGPGCCPWAPVALLFRWRYRHRLLSWRHSTMMHGLALDVIEVVQVGPINRWTSGIRSMTSLLSRRLVMVRFCEVA